MDSQILYFEYPINMSKVEKLMDNFLNENDIKQIFYSHETFVDLLYLYLAILKSESEVVDLLIKKNMHHQLANILEHLCAVKNEIVFENCKPRLSKRNTYYKSTSFNERLIYWIECLNSLFNKLFYVSVEYRRYFTQNNNNNKPPYLSIFIDFIKDDTFLSKYMQFDSGFDGFINTIQNLSINAEECKDVWNNLKSVEILLNFARYYSKWSLQSYGTISVIASDRDIEKLDEINVLIDKFVELTLKCIESKETYQANYQDVDQQVVIVMQCFTSNGYFFIIDVFLESLYRLAVNQKLKMYIFKKSDFIESLKKLIYESNDVVQFYAIRLFSQLAFSNEINQDLNKDTRFIEFIQELENKPSFKYKKLKKICTEFLWIIKNQNSSKTESIDSNSSNENSHIMISYNTGSRELCLRVKCELERLNYKVWIDVSEIHGSSLDSMAKAVENAMCVLMCVTEKYRNSVNCQAEAQYSFRRQKIIIPLIMQKGYHDVYGWLGIIIGDKIFVDFVKYEFEESMKRLIQQIQLNNSNKTSLKQSIVPEIKQSTTTTAPPLVNKTINDSDNNKINAENWNAAQVKEWCTKNNISKYIIDSLDDEIDGGVLYQLYDLKKNLPQFFYQSITKNEKVDHISVAKFSNFLKKLFET